MSSTPFTHGGSTAIINGFQARLLDVWPLQAWQDVHVLVAVSGGRDSVALLRALHTVKDGRGEGRLMVAHYNHGWRGRESDGDERFVRTLCERLEIECLVSRPPSPTAGATSEAEARAARYQFFIEQAGQHGARYIVTAHSADDQAETVLHRVLRGTGLRGLGGIPRVRRVNNYAALIRPLLSVRRREIDAYLDAIEQPVREDSSNDNVRWTRNRIRHELLPELSSYNADVVSALGRLALLAGEAHDVLAELSDEIVSQHVQFVPATPPHVSVRIECQPLRSAHGYLVRQALIAIWSRLQWPQQAMRHAHWEKLAEFIRSAKETKEMFPGAVIAQRTGDELCLKRGNVK